MKETVAYHKQLQIAQIRAANKALQARIDREDKQKEKEDKRKEEIDYIKYSSTFRQRMNSVD